MGNGSKRVKPHSTKPVHIDLREVQRCARAMMNVEDTAACLMVSVDSLEKYVKKQAGMLLREYMEIYRANRRRDLSELLWKQANSGDTAHAYSQAKYIAGNYLKYHDNSAPQISQTNNTVQTNSIAELTDEQKAKIADIVEDTKVDQDSRDSKTEGEK